MLNFMEVAMSNNNIEGLNKHLFDQLERLGNAKLSGDDLRNEIDRSKAISSVSKDVIASAKLEFEARHYVDANKMHKTLPTMMAISPLVPK